MKQVLVPTDFSDNAYQALQYAVGLCEGVPTVVSLLHSYEEQVSQLTSRVDIGKSDKILPELYDEVDHALESLLRRIRKEAADTGIRFKKLSTGLSLAKAVNGYSEKEGIDLVVMGTKGQTGSREVLFGSNTIKVLKKSKRTPILIIPPGARFAPPVKMAFATAFKYKYSSGQLSEMMEIQKRYGASLIIMHVREEEEISDTQRANLHHLMEITRGTGATVSWLSHEHDKALAISEFLEYEEVDMLVMLYYRKNYLKHFFRGSVVKQIGREPDIPYLVIPAD